jgi:hypothetical protein
MRTRPTLSHRLLPLAVLLTCLWGCAAMRAEPPEIALAGIRVENLTLSHAILIADLSLFNPNDFTISVREVDYTLSINGIQVARGHSMQSIRLAPHQYGRMPLRLSTFYLNLLRLGPLLDQRQPLPYEISGEIVLGRSLLGSHGFPFDHKGTIDLSEFTESPAGTDNIP